MARRKTRWELVISSPEPVPISSVSQARLFFSSLVLPPAEDQTSSTRSPLFSSPASSWHHSHPPNKYGDVLRNINANSCRKVDRKDSKKRSPSGGYCFSNHRPSFITSSDVICNIFWSKIRL
ncbi:hypothetical protein QVD17_31250 [Tagetes erecta]|uniref:Uncharacterized protein n=1 Tax=Tagetes erecta TaxID=13708 RepID=A0AAD8K401_TARER|nr:hypothetical protein QVD17_31250 [Tagetes erecta]